MPYHVYSGYGAFIGGFANLNGVRNLIYEEQVVPAQTRDGRALVGVWVLDFTDASLGPHHELQVSIFVGRGDGSDLAPHPFSALEAMLTRKDVEMLCYGLWNNTSRVVAYNREILSLNARLVRSRVVREGQNLAFEFQDPERETIVAKGNFANFGAISLRATLEMTKRLGLRRSFQLARQPWVRMEVVNPTGVMLSHNATATALAINEKIVVNYFDAERDHLAFGDPAYGNLGFVPQFVQYIEGFKFIYLAPSST